MLREIQQPILTNFCYTTSQEKKTDIEKLQIVHLIYKMLLHYFAKV